MWKTAERIILLVAVVLLVSSGVLFYRYVAFNAGEGGSAAFLLERINEQALKISQLEHALEVLRQATARGDELPPNSIAAAAVEDLGSRVAAIETTLELHPDQALKLPLMQKDLQRLEDEISSLQYASSNALAIALALFGFLAALVLLILGYLFGPIVTSRIGKRQNLTKQAPSADK